MASDATEVCAKFAIARVTKSFLLMIEKQEPVERNNVLGAGAQGELVRARKNRTARPRIPLRNSC
jgi:hypothetical protein